jgi:glycosyltransferase involved in cell wall biosynthesis
MPGTTALRPLCGVNVIGDLTVESGLGEATTSTLDAMLDYGIPASYTELRYHLDRRSWALPARYSALPRVPLYPSNLLFYNVHEMPGVIDGALARLTQGRYTVGVWAWELSRLPERWHDQPDRLDEIWVPSRHTQASVAQATVRPVQVIPHPIEVLVSLRASKSRWGIPDDRYTFLFSFDALSCDARKNPFAVVEAFAQAFGHSRAGGSLLVLKTEHLDELPQLGRDLRAAVARVGGMLLEERISRLQMNDLLAAADAYVSLHRAEGFGLGMAEAMYLGKPVIATGYSGNLDFMTAENSYLVGYRLRKITQEDHRYRPICAEVYKPGMEWAEPDVQQAASYMTHLHEHREEGQHRGQRAAEDIRRLCSPRVVGALIAQRLAEIEALSPPRGTVHAVGMRDGSAAVEVAAGVGTLPSAEPEEDAIAHVPPQALLQAMQEQSRDMVDRHRALLAQWEAARAPERGAPLQRLPVLGFALRTLARLATSGWLRQQQMQLNQFSREEIEVLWSQLLLSQARIAAMDRELAQLRAQVAMLLGQEAAPSRGRTEQNEQARDAGLREDA